MAETAAMLQRVYYEALVLQHRMVANFAGAPQAVAWPAAISAPPVAPLAAPIAGLLPNMRVVRPAAPALPLSADRRIQHASPAPAPNTAAVATASSSAPQPHRSAATDAEAKPNTATKIFRPWDDAEPQHRPTTSSTTNAVTPPAIESPASDKSAHNATTASAEEGDSANSGSQPAAQPAAGGGDWQVTLENFATNFGRTPLGHRCLYCGKMYSRKYGLKIHLRTHTGFKPLKCKVCQRAFGDPSNLNKHTRLHVEKQQMLGGGAAAQAGGAQPLLGAMFKCPVCGKLMLRQRDLDRHVATRHAHRPPVDPQHS